MENSKNKFLKIFMDFAQAFHILTCEYTGTTKYTVFFFLTEKINCDQKLIDIYRDVLNLPILTDTL